MDTRRQRHSTGAEKNMLYSREFQRNSEIQYLARFNKFLNFCSSSAGAKWSRQLLKIVQIHILIKFKVSGNSQVGQLCITHELNLVRQSWGIAQSSVMAAFTSYVLNNSSSVQQYCESLNQLNFMEQGPMHGYEEINCMFNI
ncbi:Hypothetical_protein [Hexamita inflata]|uniref:Hypothetical_protein n=1 Tax=Hexamita inflata TaxID=28002 RepID=A0ABP1H816_9EUKA